ncbi:hypothetical protein SAMN05421878_11345 [Actinobaculum suis]|uniref:Transposase n=1 Tax=Actinobaculum suis TaxID=1657 RepID=A0A1G7DWC7_9ACTO|nr:hypothetical protein SAMN05421878_11345 [Actinobaculum suis]
MIRFKFIEDHRTEFSVKRMCTVLKVRRSSYYKWAANAARREQQIYADGLLEDEMFDDPAHASHCLRLWSKRYKTHHPQSSLGFIPPTEYANQ